MYVEKGNEGYQIEERELAEYKMRGFEVPVSNAPDEPPTDDGLGETPEDGKKKAGQK
jgi:hypothetical protein